MNIFYVGPEHHKTHFGFTKNLIGGKYFHSGMKVGNTYEAIKSLDTPEVNWFFADLYPKVIPFLKGKKVFVPHGLGPKPYLTGNRERIDLLRRYFDQVWAAGKLELPEYHNAGIPQEKLFQVGSTHLFGIPDLPERPGSVLISCGWFAEIMPVEKMKEFLSVFPSDLHVYVTCHPSMPQDQRAEIGNICKKRNFFVIDTEEELEKAYAYCSCAIVGLSSIATPFFYLNKPVIFLKERNRFPFLQWYRLVNHVGFDAVFFKVLNESTRLLFPGPIEIKVIKNAKISKSAREMFFETNWDATKTGEIILDAVRRLEGRAQLCP